eukprot:13945762-Alexandrium_andersonii.AAC.1
MERSDDATLGDGCQEAAERLAVRTAGAGRLVVQRAQAEVPLQNAQRRSCRRAHCQPLRRLLDSRLREWRHRSAP